MDVNTVVVAAVVAADVVVVVATMMLLLLLLAVADGVGGRGDLVIVITTLQASGIKPK